MSTRRSLAYAAGGLGAAALAAVATGVVVERRVVKARRAGAAEADRLGALHSERVPVTCDDGVVLHAEVDEVAPYADSRTARRRRPREDVTLVFAHGYALNLDCWHFQREAFRGKRRMAFYDQRSHGRSDRSDREHATIDQLGDDLARVIETVAPKGKVVLVGHSMGGMSIIAFAERHPRLFAKRVAGVALIATTAGGLRPHRVVGRWIPDGLGELVGTTPHRRARQGARARRLRPSAGVQHRLHRRRHVRLRAQGRPGCRGRVPRRDARGDEVRRAGRVLPELHRARQVRAPAGVRRRPDRDHLRDQGQAHLDRPQPQDGRTAADRTARRVPRRRATW